MMISEPSEAYVWIFLPNQTQPVVAGKLSRSGSVLSFNYGQSYLARDNAIPIHEDELPLRAGELPLLNGLTAPGCIRDGLPDAWGRRVIRNKLFGATGEPTEVRAVDELTYMLESGSDRIGFLDFQRSPTSYVGRESAAAPLDQLIEAARYVEEGIPLSPELSAALHHGTSIGGARPKAQLRDENSTWIAKFSASTDHYSVVKAEYVAMRLAHAAGLDVSNVQLRETLGKDVLLVERFDRHPTADGWTRTGLVSALTLLGLDEMMARYCSYEDLADIVRARFSNASQTLRELFGRMCFNVLCGNSDDHARNHAALWNGKSLQLSPAYDICPQNRAGNEASQAMLLHGDDRRSKLSVCLAACEKFQLSQSQAMEVVRNQLQAIATHWNSVCTDATLSPVDRRLLASRQFLNPYCFDDLGGPEEELATLASSVREGLS